MYENLGSDPARWRVRFIRDCHMNAPKPGVSFANAVVALEDERWQNATSLRPVKNAGQRWAWTRPLAFLSLSAHGGVYTWLGENVRLIPARNAMKRERHICEESNEA
jgi:uncharacterized DUF497 family protein